MAQGITTAPRPATGSITPRLVTLVIRPAQPTAVGFIPAMDSAKPSSSKSAGAWVRASISPA